MRRAPTRCRSGRPRCSRGPWGRGRGSAHARGARTRGDANSVATLATPNDASRRRYEMLRTVAGEHMRRAIAAQPEWLRAVPTDRRLPEGRILHTGCGTSFHAAQTAGWAEQALELVLRPREADALVVVSHEGDTPLTLEAARAFDGPVWLVT